MPLHRLPRLPKAKRSEMLIFGAAGAAVLLPPLCMILPGAEQRLASQTAKWAPRWERNISYFVKPVERGVQRLEPPVSHAVRSVERKLPLEKMAKGVDARIRRSIERWGPAGGGGGNA